MAKGIRRIIKQVMSKVDRDIAGYSSSGSLYARGLSREGYNGGYSEALSDVLLALNGVLPKRRDWWPTYEEFENSELKKKKRKKDAGV